ncbi:MAG: sulfotransferase [Actinobacteria bacterium]|nr:sulfotransferase [Actinomycetota bacterium]
MAASAPVLRQALKARSPSLAFERSLWDAGCDVVVGVDEVGRGAWAGPLSVGVAVLPRDRRVYKIRDSKLLNEGEREALFDRIASWCRAWAVGHVSPEECDALLQNTFASQHFDDMFDARDYSAWLNSADLSEAYAFYRLQLQVLGGTGSAERTWVLKSPSHLGHLDALFKVLPGATVVHCHRHPLEAVPSYASLITTIRRPYSDEVDPAVCGRQALERTALAMERALAVRDSGAQGTFVDVSFSALARDPIGVLHALYQHLGRRLGAEVEAAMAEWLAEHPRHHQGVHRYRGADFELEPDEVTAALAGYLDRFGALVES